MTRQKLKDAYRNFRKDVNKPHRCGMSGVVQKCDGVVFVARMIQTELQTVYVARRNDELEDWQY